MHISSNKLLFSVFGAVCGILGFIGLVNSANAEDLLPDPVIGFVMGDTLQFTPNPLHASSDSLGDWSIQAIGSGLAFQQTNPVPGNFGSYSGISNLQVDIQKTNGPITVYLQAGTYAIPSIGMPYTRASANTESTFGYVPEAYIALAVGKDWSVSLGKLPSMGGVESTFTYENTNIQRGLLWTQTNSVSRGAQINYQDGIFSAAFSVNDGAYSGVYNWIGGLVSVKTGEGSAVTAGWTGSLSPNAMNTTATPLLQNNSQISNLIYQYTGDRWSFTPYAQYTYIPSSPSIGIYGDSGTVGYALLSTYHIDPLTNGVAPYRHISIPTRFEYQSSFGNSRNSNLPAGLMYGPGSSAWSATITPTIQLGKLFARIEFAYVKAFNTTSGSSFGAYGTNNTQVRGMLEAGFLY